MILGLFRRRSRDAEHKTYCEIVAQARQPVFYTDFLVPDTIDGRFDLIVLHAVLYFKRMQGEGKKVAEFTQDVFDLFFQDMDASLREMGVSDTRVPKKVRKMGEAFFGRADAYMAAVEAGNAEDLAQALGRNIYTDKEEPIAQERLAHYVIAAAAELTGQDTQDLLNGDISWPDPAAFLPEK
ncbi:MULTISPECIES: ubiquinol-cytochrome C chaperone family protein [unclassified Roseibium]|uniref:ubiquinol-cytochrome C chaperone family protein n=1 Tax=unclassified Roseibium TaxID=2629323 RepID=UPI00273DCBA8|nr:MULTISPECIES: ubiquinol-cytochrome C chaperone family protein [unclassified Roseibium]